MRMTRTAALFAVFVLLGAVSYKAAYAVSSRAPAGDYTQSDSSVPVHAFIYADHTVLELDSYSTALQINDDSGGHIGFKQDGRFARLDGKLNHFTAYVDGRAVVFTRKGWEAPQVIRIAAQSVAPGVVLDAGETEISPAASATPTSKPVKGSAAAAAVPTSTKATAAGVPPLLASSAASPALPASSTPAHVADKPVASTAAAVAAPASAASGVAAESLAVASVTLPGGATKPVDPAQVSQTWQLEAGQPIGATLQKWAESVGWRVDWKYPRDIIAPSNKTYTGDFITVSGEVISTLHKNGALIYTHFYTGDKYQRVWKSGTIAESDE
jgi:hypothetical protein